MPSSDDYAREVIRAGKDLGITDRGIIIGLATVMVESGFPIKMWANGKVAESLQLPHDAVGSDGLSVGLFQQQVRKGPTGQWWWGDTKTCMDPYKSAELYFNRLAKLDYNNALKSPGSYAQAVQQSAFPGRYDQRMSDATRLYARLTQAKEKDVPVTDNRPDFNEFPIWSSNNSARTAKVDAFIIHTQEGGGGDAAAENLAKWFQNANGVSYHYTVSQASDGGVTVVDCVDTDRASWSVLSANGRSVNLCFAGSRAAWTRNQWLKQSNACDAAAYIAVQDCRKYGIPMQVIGPPYTGRIPGITDHRYVTKILGDGTHTDVGDNFPWDVFSEAIIGHASGISVPEPVGKRVPDDFTDRELSVEIWQQLRGPGGQGWPQLGSRTPVDYLAHLGQKIDALAAIITAQKGKP